MTPPAPLSPTLVLAAITSEIEPLAARLGLTASRENLGEGEEFYFYAGEKAAIAVTGVGAERAERVADAAWQLTKPARVVITGFAGAANPAYQVGDLIEPAEIQTPSGSTFRPTAAVDPAGRLITTDHIVSSVAAKARLRQAHGADAVDMESAALAAWCERKGVPWSCVRAISDRADEALPAFVEKLTRPTGEPDVYAAFLYALTRPWTVPTLVRLGAGASHAAAALETRLHATLTT